MKKIILAVICMAALLSCSKNEPDTPIPDPEPETEEIKAEFSLQLQDWEHSEKDYNLSYR